MRHLLAQRSGLAVEEVIRRHSAREYQVFALGFAPGFAFMGLVAAQIVDRISVRAGLVLLPPALLFRIYSTLNQALGKPQLVTWLQVGSLFIKLPLSVWFTFGGAGLPAQGVVGCAWATLVVNCSMLALALWLLRTQDLYEPLGLWRRMEPPHWPTIAGFARLGIPAGLAVMVEVTSFTLMALFIARQGTTASAAHQIAANLAAVLYMVPLSLAIATSARVSYWLGAGNPAQARKVASAPAAAWASTSTKRPRPCPNTGGGATGAPQMTTAPCRHGHLSTRGHL